MKSNKKFCGIHNTMVAINNWKRENSSKKQQVEEKRHVNFKKNAKKRKIEHERFIGSIIEIMENPFSNARKIINFQKNKAKLNNDQYRARLQIYTLIELDTIAGLIQQYEEETKKLNEERDLIEGDVTTNLPDDEKKKIFEIYQLEPLMQWRKFYNNINKMLQESYNNNSTTINTSSPRNKTTSLKKNKSLMNEIRKKFFNDKGQLIVGKESGHLEKIGFGEYKNVKEEADQRLQISFERTTSASESIVEDIQKLLTQHGVLNHENEELEDCAILFGGNKKQKIHHDIARKFLCWDNKQDDTDFSHFDIDLNNYNNAIASPFAPSSMLISLHDKGVCRLGLQHNKVELYESRDRCRVISGCDVCYNVHSCEDNNIVVVDVEVGIVFTGDFPHCGVECITTNDSDEDVLHKVVEKFKNKKKIHLMKYWKFLQNCKNLNNIARFHCTTRMKNQIYCKPSDTVGFYDCNNEE